MPEDAAWADPVVVPDDIRELQADVDAYHRELRLARRRRRWRWLRLGSALGRRWRRWAFPLGVVTGALGLASLVFVVLAVDGGGRIPVPAAAPLAAPAAAPGTLDGLLPDVPLTLDGGHTVPARSVRPALIALTPTHCTCTAVLEHLAAEANEVALPLVVVAPVAPDAEVAALPGQIHRGRLVTAYDTGGRLAAAYGADDLTALVVGRDGVVTDVEHGVTTSSSLELPLQSALLLDGASGS